MTKFWKMRKEKPLSDEERELGYYLANVIFFMMVIGTAAGIVIPDNFSIKALILIILLGIINFGFSILVGFRVAHLIYEDYKGGARKET